MELEVIRFIIVVLIWLKLTGVIVSLIDTYAESRMKNHNSKGSTKKKGDHINVRNI